MEKLRKRLLVRYPFFGSITAGARFIENEDILSSATDGRDIFYNPGYLASLSDEGKLFVLAHEVCHIAFDHVFRSAGKDPDLWDLATDAVVNAYLESDGLPLTEGAVDMPEALDYDAESFYLLLAGDLSGEKDDTDPSGSEAPETKKDALFQKSQGGSRSKGEASQEKNREKGGQMQGNSAGKDKRGAGHDSHELWEEALKKRQEQGSMPSSEESQDPVSEAVDRCSALGEKEAFKENEIERRKQLEELRNSLASSSGGYGSGDGEEPRRRFSVGRARPFFEWRRLLHEAVKYNVDWSFENAEIEEGVVNARLEEIPWPETEVVLDTSGSVDEVLLKSFLRECKNILMLSSLRVGCFDTKFYGFNEIRDESDIDALEFPGGGGTDFNAAIGAFTNRVENKIIFTDGRARMPGKPCDALWIVFGNYRIDPPGGKVLYVDEEKLKKLMGNGAEIQTDVTQK